MNYSDKLKDPRWQKKRLEIFQRDDFTCQGCGSKENTLHVHHFKYNSEPWEAHDIDLITLCESCHNEETVFRHAAERALIEAMRERRLLVRHINTIRQGIEKSVETPLDIITGVTRWIMQDHALLKEIALRFYEKYKSNPDELPH